MSVDFDMRGQKEMDVFNEEKVMIIDKYFVQKQWKKSLKTLMMDLFLTNMQFFTWQDVN